MQPFSYFQAYNGAAQQQQQPQHQPYSSVAAATAGAGLGPQQQQHLAGLPPLGRPPSLNQNSYSYRAQYGNGGMMMHEGGNGGPAAAAQYGGNPGGEPAAHLDAVSAKMAAASLAGPAEGFGATVDERRLIYALVADLLHPETREAALNELSKKRDQYDDLAVVLWHSYGVMAVLLLEITRAYYILTPEKLQGSGWTRICNALALLQCVAGHEETRGYFMGAYFTLYLYPFLSTPHDNQCFQNLKLTSLGVLGALVKNDTPRVIRYLIDTDAIPVCIRIMENGNELSQAVAVFVMQKVLTDASGREYMCESEARLQLIASVLATMLRRLAGSTTYRHLKHIIRCYEKLSLHPTGRALLRQMLPKELRDASLSDVLKDDAGTKQVLTQLLLNLSDNVVS